MALVTAQAVLKSESGITADNTTNTWHFDSDFTESSFDNITTAVNTFYSSAYLLVHSPLMAVAGHELNFYDTAAPSPKPPIATRTFPISATPNTVSLPPECAIVCSFEAAKVAGQPQARRRNRIYLGPFGLDALAGDGVIDTAVRQQISAAALALMDDSNTATNWIWQVYSPTNAEAYDINNGWVDNAWDTQRRRGTEATIRSVWTNPAL